MKFIVNEREEDPIVTQSSDTSSAKCVNGEQEIIVLAEEVAALSEEKRKLEQRCYLLEEEVLAVRKALCEQEIHMNNARSQLIQYKIKELTDCQAELKMKFTSSTEIKKE